MDPQVLKGLNAARRQRKAVAVVTHLSDGRDRLVRETDTVKGELGEQVSKAFLSGKSTKLELAGEPIFINVYVPPPRLVIIGAVHISQTLAPMARIAGFPVTVIDPRTAFATPERFAGIEVHAEWPEEVLCEMPLDAYTAVAAVTHDPKIDDCALVEAMRTGCFYIGALGSRQTHAKRLERLKEKGLSLEVLECIHSPIGLDIGAASPSEIAVAILAEVIQSFHSRGLGPS